MMLEGKDAEKFIKQDKKKLTKKQVKDLKKCRETYQRSIGE